MSVESALEVVRVNGWPVFPCNPTNKRPYTLHGFKDASTDSDVIKRWWKQWPSALIGVPMGEPSGVFCVDLDRKENGSDGIATWSKWIKQYGIIGTTREHTTPSTGKHLLFKWREGIDTIPIDKLAPGVDIRGNGSYIIVPPGQMTDGRSYSGNNAPVSMMPEWFEDILSEYLDKHKRDDGDFDDEIKRDAGKGTQKEEYSGTLNKDELEFVLSFIPSDDYDIWYKYAGAIHKAFGESGYSIFENWSRQSNKFDAKECWRKWKKAPDVKAHTIASIYYRANEEAPHWKDEWFKRQRAWNENESSGNGKNNGAGQQQAKPQPKPQTKRLNRIDYAEWDNAPVPRQEWAVEERIPLRRSCLFTGEGAAGKSLLQLQLSVAHVLGKEWLGVVPRQGEVLFIDAEDEEPVMHKRLKDVLNFYGARFKDLRGRLHMVSLAGADAVLGAYNPRTGLMVATPLYHELLEMVRDIKPVMIGIASSADVFSGNELDRSQVRQFIAMLTKLAIVSNGAVNLIAHPSLTGINTDTGISGNTAWHNSVRARMYLKSLSTEDSTSTVRELMFKKNNYGPVSASIMLHWKEGLFQPINNNGASRRDVAKEIFLRLLQRFANSNRDVNDKNGVSYAPNLFSLEKEARDTGCNKEMLADAMRTLLAEGAIKLEPYGRTGSRPNFRLVIIEASVRNKVVDDELPF